MLLERKIRCQNSHNLSGRGIDNCLRYFLLHVLALFCIERLFGNPSLEEYFSCVRQLAQSSGNYREGEIEIVMDPAEISQVQKVQEARLLQKGYSAEDAAEYSRIGIVYEDQYWVWLRDAVYFPQEIPGTYDRLIWKIELKGIAPGVAVLPILPSGHAVLNLNYRHATRAWELELPRGKILAQETCEEAAFRELREETGFVASSLHYLGEMAPDSGVLSCVVPVFMGKISAQVEANPEYSEAIAGAVSFTKEELKWGLMQGFLEVPIEGKIRRVNLRDSFLTFALLQAELRELF